VDVVDDEPTRVGSESSDEDGHGARVLGVLHEGGEGRTQDERFRYDDGRPLKGGDGRRVERRRRQRRQQRVDPRRGIREQVLEMSKEGRVVAARG
jgi:hypothetical protein